MTSPRPRTETSPPVTLTHARLRQLSQTRDFIDSTVRSASSPLRHLASQASLGGGSSHGSVVRSNHTNQTRTTKATHFLPASATFEDQRVEARRGFSITKNTKIWNPDEPVATYVPPSTADGRSPRASSSHDFKVAKQPQPPEDDGVYPSAIGLAFLVTGLCLSTFLMSLDRTIITTAIPFITSEFNSYNDIGWYGSAYLLAASAFQPIYGRIYQLFNIKWSYLLSLAIFELGSLICGVAPNSIVLIIGRALAGLGSAGILTGSFVVISHAVPLKSRPVWTAVVGLMFGVGATVGPLLGGVFTDEVTWRWCFYFNLPVGVVTVVSMVIFFHPKELPVAAEKSIWIRIAELDVVGNVILLGAFLMLFLALSYAELSSWGEPLVTGLLVGAGVTFVLFCVWQWRKGDNALIPPRIIRQRTVAASCAAAFCIYSAILIHAYYLPIWFQAIKGDSAIRSGVNMIPYVVANAIFSIIAGIFVSKNGFFTAPAILGCAIGTIGAGLLSTLIPDTSSSRWIGYEILASVGIGMAIQQGFIAIQVVLPLEEVAIGTAAVVSSQSLGGAIFVSVGNAILQNTLRTAADNNEVPGVDIDAVIVAGAGAFRDLVTAEQLPALLVVYNDALMKVFIAAIVMIGLGFISCLFLEWRSIQKEQPMKDEEAGMEAQAKNAPENKINHQPRVSRTGTGGSRLNLINNWNSRQSEASLPQALE
ncbi:DNA repair protein RAD50 [Calycina marina]|uniref:DNA repair protein RAD50 n=1 Tax=Calycina marina TaxID=1763456 RepID=A0A9P7Z223_9HELO|nr:DNA repair protein RAD50 [Calycina marina]